VATAHRKDGKLADITGPGITDRWRLSTGAVSTRWPITEGNDHEKPTRKTLRGKNQTNI